MLNFVYSDSSADRVNVGTVGAAATPLYVDFDDYSHWGSKAAIEFFFARTRFTPYVGYLIGLNRYGDIRGTFVDVPLSVTPGLAAQDGKFFDKSWAFSLGRPAASSRARPLRVDVRNAAAIHGWLVGRRLARRGGPARHQQRELALVVPGSVRRQDSILRLPIARGVDRGVCHGLASGAGSRPEGAHSDSISASLGADRQPKQIDRLPPGQDRFSLKAMHVRSRELKWRLTCFLITGATKSAIR